jgi:hypothetical protein
LHHLETWVHLNFLSNKMALLKVPIKVGQKC